MNNKIIIALFLVLISAVSFADSWEIVIEKGNIEIDNETYGNIIIIRNVPSKDYEKMENKVYRLLKESNEECLKLLNLSDGQKIKIGKLQQSYLKIAKAHGVSLKKAYKDYCQEYKINPDSKETENKKEIFIKTANQTKDDYNRYQEQLFKILNDRQIKTYNEYLDRKIKEMKQKFSKNHKLPKL